MLVCTTFTTTFTTTVATFTTTVATLTINLATSCTTNSLLRQVLVLGVGRGGEGEA